MYFTDNSKSKLHPFSKLLVTVALIVFTASIEKHDLFLAVFMLLFPLYLYRFWNLSLGTALYKMRLFVPVILAVGIANPFVETQILIPVGEGGITGGMLSFLTLATKGLICLLMAYALSVTTSIYDIAAVLQKLHVPKIMVSLLTLTYRYVFMMQSEVSNMTLAYKLRAPGQKGIAFPAWGSFLGQLLLRSMDRAEELHTSMELRGFKEEFYFANDYHFAKRDVTFIIVAFAFIFFVRYAMILLFGKAVSLIIIRDVLGIFGIR